LPDYTGKHRRKIVITAFLPFNVAVIGTYLMWLLDQKAMGTEIGLAFTAFDDFDEDVAFLNTQTAEKLEVINRFKGVGNVEYTDKPACLVASAPQIRTGTDLVPAVDMATWTRLFRPSSKSVAASGALRCLKRPPSQHCIASCATATLSGCKGR
jgi:hypothetical protein